MSEYLYVEKPFLEQLAALGWTVLDQRGFPLTRRKQSAISAAQFRQ